ncbi:MAG: neutral/alkaline non-lysosomal ceramidase N-terminal domain-containing protein [Armatimonadetes bacterium]|nr:neutral/alkaline non-lysosomal ceramidase N-terminal domain-containing protein [Armatimonadota bacterium]
MHVGVGVVDITPPVGTWMSGYGGRGASESLHDPLELRALAWTDGGTTLLIVGADVLGFDQEFVAEARAALAAEHGIAPDAVLLNGSHTHCGPAIINHLVIEAPHIDAQYRQSVLDAVLAAASEALERLEPVSVKHGWGRCRVGINRRGPEPPYPMVPNPRGFYDDTVGVLAFLRPDGSAAAVVFNAACHVTTLGAATCFSADWPGAARRCLDEALGHDCRSIYLQGACGNIRPRTFDLSAPTRFRQGTVAEFTRMGLACAHEVINILEDRLEPADGALSARRAECSLPLEQQPSADELRQWAASDDAWMKAWATWLLERWPDGELPGSLPYEAQLLSVGEDVSILALPGEVVSELGFAARKSVPRPALFCGYSNGLPTYIPDARIRRQGGYEAGLRANEFFGVAGWLAEESELVILATVERLCGG